MNTMMLLEMATEAMGDRVAVTNPETGQSLTYQQMFEAAGRAANHIAASDVGRFAMLDTSSLATPVALFGSSWAGVPYVPLNYRLTDTELHGLLERIAPALLVTSTKRQPEFANDARLIATDRDSFLASDHPAEREPWSMEPEDVAVLLFTSGTTGIPKAAVLRHRHLVSYILGSVEFMGAAETDAALVSVPPYHIAGIAAMLSSVYAGRRVVQLPQFTADGWISAARQQNITNAFVVPTMLARIVDALDASGAADMPHLRAISYGGGKMPQPVIERAMELFPTTDFTNAYGLTETSSTVTVLGPEEHRAAMASDDPTLRRRIVSVGQPLPGIEIDIRDDEGRPVGAGERGEIYVRGEQVSGEYEDQGTMLDTEGWFPTRDAGSVDADGYLFLEGRADDVIVRGGENLSPGEIEDVLIAHKAVADAAVIGVPDEQWGEGVAAAIQLRPDAEVTVAALQDWVKDHLRSSRVPQRIEFWDELPYTETGKLLRRLVRERMHP